MKSLLVRVGVILIGLFILGYGCPLANAQCAWVLWEQIGNRIEGKWYPPEWHINSAFPTYDQCVQKQNKNFNFLKDAYSKSKPSIYMDTVGFSVLNPNEGNRVDFSYESKCLPDTIDPRK